MRGNGAPVRIRHFTDPGCPFAFSAERQRLRLRWLYGGQLDWSTHMIVLAETPPAQFPPERMAASRRALHERYGMPMAWTPAPAAAVTIARAATEAGIDPAELEGWMREPETEEALRADMRAARSPSPASRAQDYKLGGPAEERRYTCPSYELERISPPPADWPTANRVDLPGFRPVEAYEAAIANLAPELTRRPDPANVEEVLAWAGMPLATVDVAMVANRDVADVREELAHVAGFEPVGGDGYWSLAR